jgi:hypothetical protein
MNNIAKVIWKLAHNYSFLMQFETIFNKTSIFFPIFFQMWMKDLRGLDLRLKHHPGG